MKKIFTTAAILCSVLAAQAQDNNFNPFHDPGLYRDVTSIVAVLSGMYLVSSFIQRLLKQYYSYRIRNRMLDKGTEENIVREILLPDQKESKNYILQWFFMMLCIGAGLVIVHFVRPFGLHSLAILAFSVAAGFGAYWYFARKLDR